jgi:uncharacterized membrane protein
MLIPPFIAAAGPQAASAANTVSHATDSTLFVVGFVLIVGIIVSFAMAALMKALYIVIQRLTPDSDSK